MDATAKGQVNRSAAEVYEEFFLPALFAQWTPHVADAAGLAPGDRVLDVACGTGVLAREAARRVHPGGTVTGLDRNEGMLDVAGRVAPGIAWQAGRAEALPFGDSAFDAVVSQFGLMFFDDRTAALGEMWRVLRPGGRIAVAVFAGLERAPGYAAMMRLLQRLFGEEAADALRAPYCLGDGAGLRALVERAGIAEPRIDTVAGLAVFPSIASWVHTDVKGWTLADMIDDAQYETLKRAAEEALQPFAGPDGTVRFDHPAHIVTARKP